MTREQIEIMAIKFVETKINLDDNSTYSMHEKKRIQRFDGYCLEEYLTEFAKQILSHKCISVENYDVKAHWKEVAKCVFVAESCIVDELKELKVNMENEGKSVTEIADAYLDRIVEEIFNRSKEE